MMSDCKACVTCAHYIDVPDSSFYIYDECKDAGKAIAYMKSIMGRCWRKKDRDLICKAISFLDGSRKNYGGSIQFLSIDNIKNCKNAYGLDTYSKECARLVSVTESRDDVSGRTDFKVYFLSAEYQREARTITLFDSLYVRKTSPCGKSGRHHSS